MPRQSPPTERVTRVLDLLATNPTERFTVSELARRLGLSKATCLGIVGALQRSGYLTRDDHDKTCALGPAAMALGQAARRGYGSLDVARPHLERLAERFGIATTATKVIGDDLVILDRIGPMDDVTSAIHVGQRYPYAPPSGVVVAAWLGDAAIERWLADHTPVELPDEYFRDLVDSCRRSGYLVERMNEVSLTSYTLLAGLTQYQVSDRLIAAVNTIVIGFEHRYLLDREITPRSRHPASTITATTHDPSGGVDLLLGLLPMGEVPAAEIRRYGEAIADAALAVTTATGGWDPWRNGGGDPAPCAVRLGKERGRRGR